MESVKDPRKQKESENVIHEILLHSEDPDQPVLGMIAIPELHLLIGNLILVKNINKSTIQG